MELTSDFGVSPSTKTELASAEVENRPPTKRPSASILKWFIRLSRLFNCGGTLAKIDFSPFEMVDTILMKFGPVLAALVWAL